MVVLETYFPRFPFRHTRGRSTFEGGWKSVAFKYGTPILCNAFCIFISMWMLHVATYNYVHVMLQFEANYIVKPNATKLYNVSVGIRPADLSFGSLNDPIHYELGYRNIPIGILDKVAAFFPVCFMILIVLMDELGTFTKVMICNGFLAIGKGCLGWMTTVPDSAGWASCKERLGEADVVFFSESHAPLELLTTEAFKLAITHNDPRWCADMMWSGHTYFTCLYALAIYELTYILSRNWAGVHRRLLLGIVFVITVGEQCVEIYLVLLNRFHYSMDVFMAVLITLLFFTNGAVSIVTKAWVVLWSTKPKQIHSDGDVQLPPCCLPFCCLAGRQHIFSDIEVKHIVEGCNLDPKQVADDMRIPVAALMDP